MSVVPRNDENFLYFLYEEFTNPKFPFGRVIARGQIYRTNITDYLTNKTAATHPQFIANNAEKLKEWIKHYKVCYRYIAAHEDEFKDTKNPFGTTVEDRTNMYENCRKLYYQYLAAEPEPIIVTDATQEINIYLPCRAALLQYWLQNWAVANDVQPKRSWRPIVQTGAVIGGVSGLLYVLTRSPVQRKLAGLMDSNVSKTRKKDDDDYSF